MEDLGVLITRLKALRDGVVKDAVEVSQSMALTHKAVVVRRLQAEGIPGEQYSDKGVPAYLVEGNSYAKLNSGFDKLVKDKKKKKENVLWKDIRSAQGLQTSHVDFTFSGRTFQNLTVVEIIRDRETVTAVLGATENELADRLSYGFYMYGNFLTPNEEEKKLLLEHARRELSERLKKYKI